MSRPPVNPESILTALGVRFSTAEMPEGASGDIRRRRSGEYEVRVNAREGLQRRRFTAAHELAHYLLHRDLIDEHGHLDRLYEVRASNPSEPLSPEHEVQANKLAAQILMPATQVKRYYGMEGLNELAARFQVSPAAMRIRLKALGLTA
nr:ImmA/IrrE family metallo-endopeptidase [Aurantimonas sp. DM33-3]